MKQKSLVSNLGKSMPSLDNMAAEYAAQQGQLIQAVEAGTPIQLEDLVLMRAFAKRMDQSFGITDDRKGACKWMNAKSLLIMLKDGQSVGDHRYFTIGGQHYKLSIGESNREWISEEKLLANGVSPNQIAASKERSGSPYTKLLQVKTPY